MQIPKSTYRIPTLLLTALSEGSASKNNDSTFSLRSSASTPMISTSTATATLQASLAATALDKADPPLSREPVAGIGSPALRFALSHGGVNPYDWLAESDVKLFEQTTGGTIKDGVIYDKDGNVSTDPASRDLACSLFDMRNFGTFGPDGQLHVIKGDITAEDISNFIGYYQSKHSTAYNFDVLEKAIDTLTAKEA